MGGAFSSPLSTRININKSDVCSQDSFALLTDKRWKSSREKMISRAGPAIHGLGQKRIEIFYPAGRGHFMPCLPTSAACH